MSIRKYILLGSALIGVITVIGTAFIYKHSVKSAVFEKRMLCELFSLSQILNNHYLNEEIYPDNNDVVEVISPDLDEIKCGLPKISQSEEFFADPWGDSYCYDLLDGQSAALYSTRVFRGQEKPPVPELSIWYFLNESGKLSYRRKIFVPRSQIICGEVDFGGRAKE